MMAGRVEFGGAAPAALRLPRGISGKRKGAENV